MASNNHSQKYYDLPYRGPRLRDTTPRQADVQQHKHDLQPLNTQDGRETDPHQADVYYENSNSQTYGPSPPSNVPRYTYQDAATYSVNVYSPEYLWHSPPPPAPMAPLPYIAPHRPHFLPGHGYTYLSNEFQSQHWYLANRNTPSYTYPQPHHPQARHPASLPPLHTRTLRRRSASPNDERQPDPDHRRSRSPARRLTYELPDQTLNQDPVARFERGELPDPTEQPHDVEGFAWEEGLVHPAIADGLTGEGEGEPAEEEKTFLEMCERVAEERIRREMAEQGMMMVAMEAGREEAFSEEEEVEEGRNKQRRILLS